MRMMIRINVSKLPKPMNRKFFSVNGINFENGYAIGLPEDFESIAPKKQLSSSDNNIIRNINFKYMSGYYLSE